MADYITHRTTFTIALLKKGRIYHDIPPFKDYYIKPLKVIGESLVAVPKRIFDNKELPSDMRIVVTEKIIKHNASKRYNDYRLFFNNFNI